MPTRRQLRKLAGPAAVLCISLALSLTCWFYVQRVVRNRRTERFLNAGHSLADFFTQSLNRYIDLLYATRGFVATARSVTPATWRTYMHNLHLRAHYPGLLTVGYAPRVDWRFRRRFELDMRRSGLRGYQIFPAAKPGLVFPVTYIRVENNRRPVALGFNLFSSPGRRRAMLAACADNAAIATGLVSVKTAAHRTQGKIISVFLPIYGPMAAKATAAQRMRAVRGFLYLTFRPQRLLPIILGRRKAFHLVRMSVHDGVALAGPALYSDAGSAGHSDVAPGYATTVSAAGRHWVMRFRPASAMVTESDILLPRFVLWGGALFSMLLFGISWQQSRSREQAEESARLLRVSEQRYRTQVQQSPLGIEIFSQNGATVYVNQAWEKIWSLTAAQARTFNILRQPPKDPELLRQVSLAFQGDPIVNAECFFDRAPGRPDGEDQSRWVRNFLYSTRDRHGAIIEVVWIYEDITERKRMDRELLRARKVADEANQAKDHFLAVLSHELRNPLAPVLSVVHMLQTQNVDPVESKTALGIIRRNVELEARLIDDLLDMTRITRGKLMLSKEDVDVHSAIRHTLEICAADITGRRMRLDVRLNAHDRFVHADPARLQQALWNLIKNSIKFTSPGGAVAVRTYNEAKVIIASAAGGGQDGRDGRDGHGFDGRMDITGEKQRGLASATSDSWIIFEVQDDGIGIDAANLARVFDAFEQGGPSRTHKFGGLGLGLAIAKAMIEAHGGTISAHSDGIGKGALFQIRLPAFAFKEAPAAPAAPQVSPDGEADRALPRILLVEDQDDARRALALVLQKMGYAVRAAATAAEAMQLVGAWPFDLLISDIGLPDLSGLELVRKIKQERAVRSIALSGYGMDQDIINSKEAGFDCHLTKPVNFLKLESTIQELVQPSAAPAGKE